MNIQNKFALGMVNTNDLGSQDGITWFDSSSGVNGGPTWEDPYNTVTTTTNASVFPPNTPIDNHFRIFDRFSFKDLADINPENGSGSSLLDLLLSILDLYPNLNSDTVYVSHSTTQNSMSTVAKAMLVALLDNNGKRTTNLASRTLAEKKTIFFNALKKEEVRDNSSLPWSTWRDSHSTVNISTVSRSYDSSTDEYTSIFTTSSPHGLDSSYDDWAAIININDSSFNTSIDTNPNGIPITIVDNSTFSMKFGTSIIQSKSVTGTAIIKIGWGNESIKFHMFI